MANHNVWLTNYWTLLDGLAMGMWNYSILGPYLFKLCGDNRHAGYAEGIQGTLQALAALPAGVLADRSRRDRVLQFSAFIGLAGIAVTLIGLTRPFNHWQSDYALLVSGLGLFGIYMGAVTPPLWSIYADSVPSGNRSKYETIRYVLSIASLASGPITNVFLFMLLGDKWGLRQMTIIFMIGISMHVFSIAALFFFDDDKSLGEETQGLLEGSAAVASQQRSDDEEDAAVAQRYAEVKSKMSKWSSWLSPWMVPYIACTSDVLFGFASGMTMKFFPVYFAEFLHLSPTVVNMVFVLDPLTEVVCSLAGQRLSLVIGRVYVLLIFKIIGISLLVLMASFPMLWLAHPFVLCAIYVLRSAFINCVVPLNRSIIMDYASVSSRGKWNSVDSIAAFGWSGSAVIGGVLIDLYGFEMSFVCTAILQLVAWLPLIGLVPLVLNEDEITAQKTAKEFDANNPSLYQSTNGTVGAIAGAAGNVVA